MYTAAGHSLSSAFKVEIVKGINQTQARGKGMVVVGLDVLGSLVWRREGSSAGCPAAPLSNSVCSVGVITHVFVNNPTKGYASFAEWMVYEGRIVDQRTNSRMKPACYLGEVFCAHREGFDM